MRATRVIAPFVASTLKGLVATATVPEPAAGPTIGTHDGSFHCDEAMACGLLRSTSRFANATVVRTRAPAELAKCTAVVDVGAVYDNDSLRYDHHQNEFKDTMMTATGKVYKTRLSSAGLIYKHYGIEIIKAYVAECLMSGRITAELSAADVELVHDRVYKGFVEHVDGIDNGVEHFSAAAEGGSLVENYKVPSTLSSRIGLLYPNWNAESTADVVNQRFIEAVNLALTEFMEIVDFYVCAWLPAQAVVASGVASATEHHFTGAIAVFTDGGCPWKGILQDLEEEAGCEGRTLYVLYPDGKGGWRVQCVPKNNSAFASRKPLPWKGLRDEALDAASGVAGGVFVHASGFIGGNRTFDGALAMAVKAVELEEDNEDPTAAKRLRE